MSSRLKEVFEDAALVERIKSRLPYMFQLAELESSRAGKIGMEVGSLRERILVALLIYKFGEENVETDIPITAPEVDAKLFGEPISIKTITGKRFGGVKLVWTVDADKVREFYKHYHPTCDLLLARIDWEARGGLYYAPVESQRALLETIGRSVYIKLPKKGTNPRGAEISSNALSALVTGSDARSIPIDWQRRKVEFNQFKRWVDLWRED